MDWSSLFAVIYLLGALFTAAVTAKPVQRIMAEPQTDPDEDARTIALFVILGVAVIWPLTLPFYVAARLIPASADNAPEEPHSIEVLLVGRYGRPE